MPATKPVSDNDARRTPPVRVALAALVCAVLGWALGFVSWAVLSLAYRAIEVVWRPILSGAVPASVALVVCTAGGAFMGWWNRRFDSAPESFADVMAHVRENWSYKVEKPLAALGSFIMPLALGGPVGPEAGLTGFIAAGCTRIGQVLARVRGGSAAGGSSSAAGAAPVFTRPQKFAVYGIGIAAGALGVASFNMVVGGAGFPRFAIPEVTLEAVLWVVPLTLAGMALSWVFRRCVDASTRLSSRFGDREPLRAAVCGLVLALVSLALPYVMFPGTEQVAEVLAGWGAMGSAALFATAVLKLALLALCLAMGWHGGPFFPLIFSAMCCGLAMAGVFGVDPALSVIVVSSALMARFTRKIGPALGIMLICVPVPALAWTAVPLVAGAMLPTVEELRERRRAPRIA